MPLLLCLLNPYIKETISKMYRFKSKKYVQIWLWSYTKYINKLQWRNQNKIHLKIDEPINISKIDAAYMHLHVKY